jgi:DnaK suppressor protein
VKKPLKTSSKTAVKKNSAASNSKAKVTAPAKKVSKPAPAKAAPPKAVTKGKPVVNKAAAKATPKTPAKPAPKAVSKPATKPLTKAAAKPATKAIPKGPTKPVTKTSPKTVAKPAPKPATKPVAKATVKPTAKTVKAPAKVVAKAQPVAKAAPKAAAKPVPTPKPVAKPAVKPESKTEVKPAKAATKPAAKQPSPPVQAQAPAKPAKEDKNKSKAPVPEPVVEAPVVAADVPARAVRPSARLAQITVPSMAQSVASTAAKASYLQNMPTQVLTPPPFVAVKKDPKLANNWKTKKPDQLTDAEVMAMSDNEYMNDAQMAFFRLKLVQLKQGILANAGETTEHLREDTVVVPDPADRATIEEEHALELRTRDRERKLLKKIEQSIQRIDAGDYGYCDETGEPIGVGRLLARPTANLSLEAQQRRELKQKMFGD